MFEEGFGTGAGLWVVKAGFAEGAQECYAACAHFALPVFEGVFEGGVVAGTGGFAHLAGFILHGEVFGAQDAVVEGFDGPGSDEWAHGFDEVAGEGFAAVFDAVVVADAGIQSGEVDLAHHGVVQQGVAQGEPTLYGSRGGLRLRFVKWRLSGRTQAMAAKVLLAALPSMPRRVARSLTVCLS